MTIVVNIHQDSFRTAVKLYIRRLCYSLSSSVVDVKSFVLHAMCCQMTLLHRSGIWLLLSRFKKQLISVSVYPL